MTLKIRKGIFETNSSSSHSLTLRLGKTHVPDRDDEEIELGVGEYGWDDEGYDTWLEKADYLIVDALPMNYSNWSDDPVKTFDSVTNKISISKVNLVINAIKLEYPNLKIKITNSHDCGYIDHQSGGYVWGELNSNIDSTPEAMRDFLFGPSVIYTGNDNG